MAEGGLLSGMLGGEEEAPEFEGAAEGLIEADAFAAAVAADQAKLDPRVARATVGFLEQQTRLLKVQTKHLEDEHALRLSHLRNQSQEGRLRRTGQRLRLGMQAGVALLFAAVGLGLIIMVVAAITSNEVIVEAFDTSPGLAATGITGKVAANAVLDALQELQGATRSVEKGPNAQTAWSSDVQIEVPETGVSIGEIDRLLHQHFGHDLHISGDVRQTPSGGVLLTIRGDDVPARSFAGSAADFDKLAVASAEYAYGSAQPARFAVYLVNNNRNADALSFLPGAFARAGSDALRAKLANGWGNAYLGLNQPAKAAEKYRLAITLDANLWNPRSNLPLVLQLTDGENAGWRASQDFLQAARRAPAAQRPPLRLLENAASFTWDLPLLLAALQDDSRYNGGAGSATNIDGPLIADTYALMHDWDAAARSMEASDPDDAQTKAEALLLQGTGAMERGDFAAAVKPLEAFWKAWQASPDLQTTYSDSQCNLGLAYGMAGRVDDAAALFKNAGPWSRCAAFHGDVLAHAGDFAGAARIWAESLRLVPDLPHVYLHRGRFALGRGDIAAAISDFAAATARAPHYADPLKSWGDALSGQGLWKASIEKYDEALKYAPAWAGLHQARSVAALKL